jgi:hypothetical protein
VFASALWGIDHFYTLAKLGVAGVNVQTGTNINGGLTCKGIYLPVCNQDGVWVARPLYYAMLLFPEAAVGRSVPVQVTAEGGSNFVAHATVGNDGVVRVALINKEASTAQTSPWRSGPLRRPRPRQRHSGSSDPRWSRVVASPWAVRLSPQTEPGRR